MSRFPYLFRIGALLGLALAGCESGALPRGEETTESPWTNFSEAKAAYDKIAVGSTTRTALNDLGFDPFETPNISILSYVEVIDHFMPHDAIRLEDLEDGVRRCIEARSRCQAYRVEPGQLKGRRTGNVLADVFNFRRHTIRSGWSFLALVLIEDDVVVYKIWSGQPKVQTQEEKRNPLGPLQTADDIVRPVISP